MLPPTTCPTNSTEPFYIINTRETNAVGVLYKDKPQKQKKQKMCTMLPII